MYEAMTILTAIMAGTVAYMLLMSEVYKNMPEIKETKHRTSKQILKHHQMNINKHASLI